MFIVKSVQKAKQMRSVSGWLVLQISIILCSNHALQGSFPKYYTCVLVSRMISLRVRPVRSLLSADHDLTFLDRTPPRNSAQIYSKERVRLDLLDWKNYNNNELLRSQPTPTKQTLHNNMRINRMRGGTQFQTSVTIWCGSTANSTRAHLPQLLLFHTQNHFTASLWMK